MYMYDEKGKGYKEGKGTFLWLLFALWQYVLSTQKLRDSMCNDFITVLDRYYIINLHIFEGYFEDLCYLLEEQMLWDFACKGICTNCLSKLKVWVIIAMIEVVARAIIRP